MTKKKKIKLGVIVGVLSSLSIIIPTSIYYQSINTSNSNNNLSTSLSSIYVKKVEQENVNNTNKYSAFYNYNNLPTSNYSYLQIANGDLNINHGNYLFLIGNFFDLKYQALNYSNFSTSNNINSYHTYYQSLLWNEISSNLGFNIPVFEYTYFPELTNNQINNRALTPYYAYTNYLNINQNSHQAILFNKMLNYIEKIWNFSSTNNEQTLLIAFVNGKANLCSLSTISSLVSSSDVTQDGTYNTTSSGVIQTGDTVNTSTKQSIITKFQNEISTFLQSNYIKNSN